jgi:hypothetical protein
MNSPTSLASAHHADLRRKVIAVIWTLRGLAGIYIFWVLLHILRLLRDTPEFLRKVGSYWQRDLNSGASWQIWSAVGLNLTLWLMLLAAVICLWRATRHLLCDMGLSPITSSWLQRGAWAGLSSAVLGILTRPLWSYLVTLHLPVDSQLWTWEMYPSDLLGLLMCGVLLMLAYLMAWVSEIAEENKAFV